MKNDMLNDEKRGVEEAYCSAGNSSDMRVEADLRGDADMIIAAGWSPSRVGMALLRLHSEWDMAAKPRKPTAEQIAALATSLPRIASGKVDIKNRPILMLDVLGARKQAGEWYARETLNLIGKLGSLPAVRRQLVAYVPKWGIHEAELKVPAIIAYWLDQVCHNCHGLKFLQVAGTPSLSTKACRTCHGTGVAAVPFGNEGKRVANYMDSCVGHARTSIKRRLRSYMPVDK